MQNTRNSRIIQKFSRHYQMLTITKSYIFVVYVQNIFSLLFAAVFFNRIFQTVLFGPFKNKLHLCLSSTPLVAFVIQPNNM